MKVDPGHSDFCARCGYDLFGIGAVTACPECGLGRKLCDFCGFDLGTAEDSSHCPGCGRVVVPMTEWQLRFALMLPWRKGLSAFWTSPPRTSRGRSGLVAVCVAAAALAAGLAANSFAVRYAWHQAAIRASGRWVWSWRANDLIVAHWGDILAELGYGTTRSVLYDRDESSINRKYHLTGRLRPHERPSVPPDCKVRTSYFRRSWEACRWNDVASLWGGMLAPVPALLLVLWFVPPLGLWLATAPGTRLSYLYNGGRRCMWAIPAGVFCQGAFLILAQLYDLASVAVGWPYVGTYTLVWELLVPVFVTQVLILRAISFDRSHLVFSLRLRTVGLILAGIVLTCGLALLWSVAVHYVER